jgi:N-acetylglutamate synthase-like GNAT family acetyltransferase
MTSSPDYQLRPASKADWLAIEALLKELKLPTEGAYDHLATYVIATQDGQLLGCTGAEIYPSLPGSVALLRSVAIAPQWQRRGVGEALVKLLLEQVRKRGIHSVHLLTVTAPEYFARFGFKRDLRENAPAGLLQSVEFQGVCPSSAAFMTLPLVTSSPQAKDLPVAVIGAGPVGLAAAARLIERGITPLVLEAGDSVGAHLLAYGHVRLFSPWRYNLDPAMRAQLEASAWSAPPLDDLPLAKDMVNKVLQPFAALPAVSKTLHLQTRVQSVSRLGFDKVKSQGRDQAAFLIRAEQAGSVVEFLARQVLDASGTWSQPNPMGSDGLPARGELAAAEKIVYGIPDVLGKDRERYAGQRTLVVGAGHSAANALLALAELAQNTAATELLWAVRSSHPTRVFGGGQADGLPARGALGAALKALNDQGRLTLVAGLRITDVQIENDTLTVTGLTPEGRQRRVENIQQIIVATGQRPNLQLSSELRLGLDLALESTQALGPLIDPNLHSCGTVRPHGHRELAHPEAGYYTVGIKSYGRAPSFLMATGYEQVRSVVAAMAGDMVAADRVELDLPTTGVCSLSQRTTQPAPAAVDRPEVNTVTALPVSSGTCGGGGGSSGGCASPSAAKEDAAVLVTAGGMASPPKARTVACSG